MNAELPSLVLDGALAVAVAALGWGCVLARGRLESICLFIAVGIIMAIVWTRLAAPDLALAEAGLGAGLTGALLFACWAGTRAVAAPTPAPLMLALLAAVLSVALATMAVTPLLSEQAGLGAAVATHVQETGVTHPVTAVLLDFRSFDTLLELAVLVAALAAVWLAGVDGALSRRGIGGAVSSGYVRFAAPLLVVLAGVLLWRGAAAPGGAFQAGVTLAAALVLVALSLGTGAGLPAWLYRATAVSGVAAFIVMGLFLAVRHGVVLDWPGPSSAPLVLAVESAATVSIAVILVLLLLGDRPGGASRDQEAPR